jgi:hypothetical protein
MPAQTPEYVEDRPSPLAFMMPAGMIGAIIWLCMLLVQVMP